MASSSKLQWPISTFVNMATVAVGSILGLLLQSIFTDDIQSIVFQAVGLGTILIGLKMALKLPDGYMLIFIFAMIIGGISGQLIGLVEIMSGLSDQLKSLIDASDSSFTEGLITAFLLFCIGSMIIPMLIFQGGITVLAEKLKPIFDQQTLDLVSAIGGILIIGISINMLKLGEITLENLLPAIVVGILFSKVYQWYKHR